MRLDRFTIMAMVLLYAISAGGCAPLERMTDATLWFGSTEERNFDTALQYLRSGNESGARELLERTVSAGPVIGVTDEALFRLALLSLRDEGGKGEQRARVLLNRLIREFPDSIWARQAAPLAAYLQDAFMLRVGHKNLRNQNFSLSRDNKEMRQSIERLKQLDIELEKKIRR